MISMEYKNASESNPDECYAYACGKPVTHKGAFWLDFGSHKTMPYLLGYCEAHHEVQLLNASGFSYVHYASVDVAPDPWDE